MRYQHQNTTYRIRKNDFLLHSSKLNYLTMSSVFTQGVSSLTRETLLENANHKLKVILRKKDKPTERLIVDKVGVKAFKFINHSVSVVSKKTLLLFSVIFKYPN